jgi:hypothetical protein
MLKYWKVFSSKFVANQFFGPKGNNIKIPNPMKILVKISLKFNVSHTRKPLLREGLSTIDLVVPTRSAAFSIKTLIYLFYKISYMNEEANCSKSSL